MRVKFYNIADDEKLKFAVIIARSGGRWVFCRHKERSTLEIPGGHREPGETVAQTAERELREETGAEEFTLKRVCVYSVTGRNRVNSSRVRDLRSALLRRNNQFRGAEKRDSRDCAA